MTRVALAASVGRIQLAMLRTFGSVPVGFVWGVQGPLQFGVIWLIRCFCFSIFFPPCKVKGNLIHNDGLSCWSQLIGFFCQSSVFFSFFLSFTHKHVRITDVLFFYSYDRFGRSFLSVFSVASYLYRQDVPAADYIIPGGRGV